MTFTKFHPNISNCSGENVDLSGLAVFSHIGHFFILEHAEFHYSETLQLRHTARKI